MFGLTFLYTRIFGATSAIDLETIVATFVFFEPEDDALSDSDVIVTIFIVKIYYCETEKSHVEIDSVLFMEFGVGIKLNGYRSINKSHPFIFL